mgnify:CR=1 FL=1
MPLPRSCPGLCSLLRLLPACPCALGCARRARGDRRRRLRQSAPAPGDGGGARAGARYRYFYSPHTHPWSVFASWFGPWAPCRSILQSPHREHAPGGLTFTMHYQDQTTAAEQALPPQPLRCPSAARGARGARARRARRTDLAPQVGWGQQDLPPPQPLSLVAEFEFKRESAAQILGEYILTTPSSSSISSKGLIYDGN